MRTNPERKKAGEDVLQIQDRLKRSQEIAHLGSWELDLSNDQLYWSDEVYRIFGLKPQEFGATYEAFLEAVHPDDRATVDAAYSGSVREGKDSYEIEHRIVRKSTGEVRYVHEKGQHIRDQKGNIILSIGMVHDITERKKAEEALRASEHRFRSLFSSMTEGVCEHELVYDTSGKAVDYVITAVNPAYEAITRLDAAKAIQMRASELYGSSPPPYLDIYAKVAETGKPCSFETYYAPMEKHFSISVFSPGRGKFVTVFSNITERKRHEEEIKKANEELEERVRRQTEEVFSERQRLYQVLETLPVYVVLLDKDYHVPFANRFFQERFGESHGKRCYEYLFNRNGPCENCETYKVMQTRAPLHWEWLGPDGRNYDIYDYPFRDTDGSLMILEMGIDVTERKKAEAALGRAGAYNRSLIEANIDPLVTIGPDGKITDVNTGTEAATGLARDKVIGTDFSDYFTDPEMARAGYEQVFREGSVRDYPLELRHRDGHVTPVLYNASVYRDEAGKVVGVFAAARDITKRRKAEAALKELNETLERRVAERTAELSESEERFRAIAETSPVQISVSRASDGNIIFTNQAYDEAFGFPRGGLIGRKAPDLYVDPEDREALVKAVAADGFVRNYEVRVKRSDGSPFWISASVRRITYGGEAALLGASVDITERKQAEEDLRQTRDYLENLLDYANAPIIVWNPEFEITRFNHAFERLTGRAAGEVLGKKLGILFPDESREESMGHIRRAAAGERWEVVEIPILRIDGTVRTVLWNSATVYAPDGRTAVATIAQGQDITERKQAEEDLKRTNAELEASNRELEAFSYSVSHDLRAPLRSMEGFSTALLEDYAGKLDDQGKQYLRYVQESSDLMGRLIDDLLKLSRVTRSDMSYEVVDLSKLAREVADKLKKAEPLRRVELKIAPGITAFGDGSLLRLVLENLLGNAWKFTSRTDAATIEIGITEHNGKQAYFIRDNGVGFDMKYVEKLFKPFQRLHKSTDFAGTGIGLATVQRIIHRHGGDVWAEGKVGAGATFYFTLSR